ncbi:hypothetical protein CDAR_111811 [Caerostris darwini]|uniref:Uncharacterized protein n=1 Tax=Caerostris darwini TaxID=1538125 RepID=A0AAV4Q3E4_9ARAC|nr:hypothetical protein CDAR_111811 [Caerostris darwini]
MLIAHNHNSLLTSASSKRIQKWRSQRNCQTIFLRGVSEGVLEGRPPPLFYEIPLSAMDLHQMASPCQRVVNCSERYLSSRDGKRMDTPRPSASCAAERGKSSLRPPPFDCKSLVWFSADSRGVSTERGEHRAACIMDVMVIINEEHGTIHVHREL